MADTYNVKCAGTPANATQGQGWNLNRRCGVGVSVSLFGQNAPSAAGRTLHGPAKGRPTVRSLVPGIILSLSGVGRIGELHQHAGYEPRQKGGPIASESGDPG